MATYALREHLTSLAYKKCAALRPVLNSGCATNSIKHDWITADCQRLANSRHARATNGSKRRTDRRTAMQRIGGAEATQRFRPAFFAFMLPID